MLMDWFYQYSDWFLLGVIILAFCTLLLRQYLINKAPTYTASATVISRRLGTARYHGKWSSGWNHLVTFQLGGGDALELYVGELEYAALTEGLQGTLVWQNENMLEFDTDT